MNLMIHTHCVLPRSQNITYYSSQSSGRYSQSAIVRVPWLYLTSESFEFVIHHQMILYCTSKSSSFVTHRQIVQFPWFYLTSQSSLIVTSLQLLFIFLIRRYILLRSLLTVDDNSISLIAFDVRLLITFGGCTISFVLFDVKVFCINVTQVH